MVTRRSFMLGLAAAGAAASGVAEASVARALTLNELVHKSRHTVVGTPVDAFCRWETIGKRQRIVTYSLVRVEEPLDGRHPDTAEVMVRTLGGSIGELGQIVHGEAALALNRPAAVFLTDVSPSLFRVTAMSQGHYPLHSEANGVKRLRAGVTSLELFDRENAAVRRLDGQTLLRAQALLVEELHRGIR